jgi:hypothetical protein
MYVDSYCERTAPGLWGEPLNALTNVAFLAASAFLLWLLIGQPRRPPVSVWLLPVLLGVVGLCSLAFHTFATRATSALDSLSILVFILVAVVVTTHWMWGVRRRWAWLAAPAFFAFSLGVNWTLVTVGGENATLGGYLPALVALLGFGLAIRLTAVGGGARFGTWLLLATVVFAVSLSLRSLDLPLCQAVPIGTHFLWHCLNATVLFVIAYAVLRRWQLQDLVGPDALIVSSGSPKGVDH